MHYHRNPRTHPSGSPAFRTPSKRFGILGAIACSHLTVSLGSMRRASTNADFASSAPTKTEGDRPPVGVDSSVEMPDAEFCVP
jgi:hypothetical protein